MVDTITIKPAGHDDYAVSLSTDYGALSGSFTTCGLYALAIQIYGVLSQDYNFLDSLAIAVLATDSDGFIWSCPLCSHVVHLPDVCNSIVFPRTDSNTPLTVCPGCGHIVRLDTSALRIGGGRNA